MASQRAMLDDQLESDRTRQFQEFLDDRVRASISRHAANTAQGTYSDAVKTMLDRKARRLIVSLDDLRAHSRELCDGYQTAPRPKAAAESVEY